MKFDISSTLKTIISLVVLATVKTCIIQHRPHRDHSVLQTVATAECRTRDDIDKMERTISHVLTARRNEGGLVRGFVAVLDADDGHVLALVDTEGDAARAASLLPGPGEPPTNGAGSTAVRLVEDLHCRIVVGAEYEGPTEDSAERILDDLLRIYRRQRMVDSRGRALSTSSGPYPGSLS